MNATSATPDPLRRDLRPLVLLVVGFLLCLGHLWREGGTADAALGLHRSLPPAEDRYLWLTGGALPDGLYLVSSVWTLDDLYRAAALSLPPGGFRATGLPTGIALTLRDQAEPLVGPMANPARPLFFQAIAINQADRELLATVPGIGPALADAIVRLREQRGGFSRPADLLDVRGIGPVKLARFRPYLEFDK